MKKTMKRVLCFFLALVVMISMPLDIQANAVATETWMIYALITYLAGMGITFTVAGGVDAMIQALEDKVSDYEQQNNIIDFYEVFRNNNVKLVPSGGQDPEGNDFFNIFFNGLAVEAIQAFANWLTENGWGVGSNINYSNNTGTYTYFLEGVEKVGVTGSGINLVDSYEKSTSETFEKYELAQEGTLIPFSKSLNKDYFYYIKGSYSFYFSSGFEDFSTYSTCWAIIHNYSNASSTANFKFNTIYSSGLYDLNTVDLNSADDMCSHILGFTFVLSGSNNEYFKILWKLDDGYYYSSTLKNNEPTRPSDTVVLSSSVDIITPEEFAEQFPNEWEGVELQQQLEIGDPSLIEWANTIEELFIDTGTIPQPQPEVVTDPDYAPEPTPAPTPVPSPEIEDIDDLGLPSLGTALFNKFPFSLPKDLKRIADILNAERITPVWEVDLYETLADRIPFRGDTTLRIDLGEYEEIGQITRWASVISFAIFLIIITKGMIRW